MADYWYVASTGERQGPVDSATISRVIAEGGIGPSTLVWSTGMPDWAPCQQVPEFAGSFAGLPPPPPPMPRAVPASGQLIARLSPFGLLGRGLLIILSTLLIVPMPWVLTAFYAWMSENITTPTAGRLKFVGKPTDIWPAIMGGPVLFYVGQFSSILQIFTTIGSWVLSAYIIRWFCTNLQSEDGSLKIRFEGGYLPYIGWNLLLILSCLTIIGWAWALKYWLRWMCTNTKGSKSFQFIGGGFDILWRTLAVALGCMFVIPIPWLLSWYSNWMIGQIVMDDRATA